MRDAVADAQVVFVAVPVGGLSALVGEALAVAPADCVVTDVGSTKREVVAAHDDARFVGGHPLAGAENAGVEHARADLFEAATWYLTPSAGTSGMLYERLHRLLHAIGARPTAIDADTHDRILAAVSHLPHVLANVLVSQAAATLAHGDARLPATGPSFRDATRVAGAPSAIWTDIYLSNRDALVTARSTRPWNASAPCGPRWRGPTGRRITAWNEHAATDRRRLLEAQLAGGDAARAARLGAQSPRGGRADRARARTRRVNITDMALYPASDMTEGVIAMWIAGEGPPDRALQLIAGLGFPVARP